MTHPYGWLSILPPIVAIVCAMITRRILLSLLVGIFLGSLIMTQWRPDLALVDTLETHLWVTLVDESKLRVFAFTMLMGAMVGVVNRCGGMRGLVDVAARWASTRVRGQLTVWILGMLVFFDDYANTLLLGSTLRPLCDRLRISREKLAYLVDSTAAPVAGLALVSTWVAVELDYVREGLDSVAGIDRSEAFRLFVASIPYRFYVLLSLLMIPMSILMRRELGPMYQAECRALARPEGSSPTQDHPVLHDPTEPEPNTPARWYNAVLPIAVTVSMVILLIVLNGRQNYDPSSTTNWWIQVFGSADPAIALQYGALAGLTVAALLAIMQRLLTSEQVVQAAFAGARFILPAFAILWFASSLSRMTGNQPVHPLPDDGTEYPYRATRLYTGEFLQQALLDSDAATSSETTISETRRRHLRHWLPTIIFTLAAAVSFCTGTSFGTMGLLVPMTLSLACAIAGANAANDPFVYLCLGGVLAGSIFGDHCSPISDTTVLSSQASGCDHVAHVWTQFPYAIVVGLLSIFLGTIPMGFGVPLLVLYPLQFVAMAAILRFVGKEAKV